MTHDQENKILYSEEQVIQLMNLYGQVRYNQGMYEGIHRKSEIIKRSKLLRESLKKFDESVPLDIRKHFDDLFIDRPTHYH